MPQNSYVLTTDSNSELPLSLAKAYNVPFVPMNYLLDDKEYFYDLGENTDFKWFFNNVRTGKLPTTSAYSPLYYVEYFRPFLEAGQDVLHVSFSSGMSATFSYIEEAVEELKTLYPDRCVVAVDTLSISGGAALLVYGALKRRAEGQSLDDVAAWVRTNALRAHHWLTVNDLNHLRRGGRLSATTAFVGSVLNLKPILTVNREGKVVAADKVTGRRKAMRYLAERAGELAEDPQNNACVIMHADCEVDAEELKAQVLAVAPFAECFVQFVGPVIGTHAGPDVLAVCFLGKERTV